MEAIFDPMESEKANENRPQTTGITFRTGRIKDDAKAQALLDILETVETKNRALLLEEEINNTLPQ